MLSLSSVASELSLQKLPVLKLPAGQLQCEVSMSASQRRICCAGLSVWYQERLHWAGLVAFGGSALASVVSLQVRLSPCSCWSPWLWPCHLTMCWLSFSCEAFGCEQSPHLKLHIHCLCHASGSRVNQISVTNAPSRLLCFFLHPKVLGMCAGIREADT